MIKATPKNRTLALIATSFAVALSGELLTIDHERFRAAALYCAFAALLSAIHWLSHRLWNMESRLNGATTALTSRIASEMHSMHVLLERFPQCTIPTTPWSMRFSNVHAIISLLDKNCPKSIVEFGSGLSTLCIGAWLKEQRRGRLVSFEHDVDWAAMTQQYVTQHDLNDYVDVVVAPLKLTDHHALPWYALHQSNPLPEEIDFLVIDGPPAGRTELENSRFPALPQLYHLLAPDAVVLLDDAYRRGESDIMRRWQSLYPEFSLRIVGGFTGLAVLERNRSTAPATENVPVVSG